MKQHSQKLLSLLLCLAMVLSVFAGMGAPAAAADVTAEDVSQGKASSSFEPWGHGYRMVDILNFDPATDPYSQELVASVPLQERNATFAATQANKDLSDDSKLYVISSGNYRSTDVNEAPWNAGMSYDDFSYNLFKFWQYADMVGAGGRPTQNIAIGSADKEYGIIAVPMAAATNAAHKNGVITLAEYFIPRTPQYTEEWLYQAEDGSFPYAQKLVDLAKYYGFDGYFINQEASIDSLCTAVPGNAQVYAGTGRLHPVVRLRHRKRRRFLPERIQQQQQRLDLERDPGACCPLHLPELLVFQHRSEKLQTACHRPGPGSL